MKYFHLLMLSLFLFLQGCENSVRTDVGGLANVEFSGTVQSANIRHASIQLVGIGSNGQPQRDDGEFFADRYITNEEGYFEGAVQGAYAGALLLVASYYDDGKGNKTQIRCALQNGCYSDGDIIDFSQWYDAPEDLELWAALDSISEGQTLHISVLTHLAAKLAFSEFVSDGTSCDDVTCSGTIAINSILTPQSIFEANDRVRKMFALENKFHINTQAWSPFVGSVDDDVVKTEQAKHGLLLQAFMQLAKNRSENFMQSLTWWLDDSFLKNQGQLIQDDQLSTGQLDFKTLYQTANDLADGWSDESVDSNVTAASIFFSGLKAELVANEKSIFEGGVLDISMEEKIFAAKTLVADVQGWVVGLENENYESFFDAGIDADIEAMEIKIAAFKQQLSPELKTFFKPMMEFVNYGLSCIRTAENNNSACDSAYTYHTDVVLDASTGTFTLSKNMETENAYPKIYMKGTFDEPLANSDLFKRFSFTETVSVETQSGKVKLLVDGNISPKFDFYLSSALDPAQEVDLAVIEMTLPELKVSATGQDMVYVGRDIELDMVGVKDATRPNEEKRFNIRRIEFPGQLQDGSDELAEMLDITLIVNSKNAATFYPDTKFPDLTFAIDLAALKQYSQFGAVDLSTSTLAGWLRAPSNVVLGETLTGAVTYIEEPSLSALESELQTLLDLDSAAQVSYAALEYPGGKTALIIWKNKVEDKFEYARQCIKASNVWGCATGQLVNTLGCGNNYGVAVSSVADAFSYLKDEGCIAQVVIDGRGIYDIQYPDNIFISLETYDVILNEPILLGMETFNVRLISRFLDETDSLNPIKRPVGMLNILGQALDEKNITLGVSLTHGYAGLGTFEGLGLTEIVPYGERTLWFAMGRAESADSDSLIYYIQKDNVTLNMAGHDNLFDHENVFGYLRYSGTLVGTLTKEGSKYVVRYINGDWQLL